MNQGRPQRPLGMTGQHGGQGPTRGQGHMSSADPWSNQNTPNDLASLEPLPLEEKEEELSPSGPAVTPGDPASNQSSPAHSGALSQSGGSNVFKEPTQRPPVTKDSKDSKDNTLDVYDNGFKRHIPVESLIFR